MDPKTGRRSSNVLPPSAVPAHLAQEARPRAASSGTAPAEEIFGPISVVVHRRDGTEQGSVALERSALLACPTMSAARMLVFTTASLAEADWLAYGVILDFADTRFVGFWLEDAMRVAAMPIGQGQVCGAAWKQPPTGLTRPVRVWRARSLARSLSCLFVSFAFAFCLFLLACLPVS